MTIVTSITVSRSSTSEFGYPSVNMTEYRDFRLSILAEGIKRDRDNYFGSYKPGPGESFSYRRQLICKFRQYVEWHFETLLNSERATETVLRRSLGIPFEIPLIISNWRRCLIFLSKLLPSGLMFSRASGILRKIKTFEGRSYVFSYLIKNSFQIGWDHYFEGTDVLLRRFRHSGSTALIEKIRHSHENILHALHGLGVHETSDLSAALKLIPDHFRPEILRVLVEERVLTKPEDLNLLRPPKRHSYYSQTRPEELDNLRKIVSQLRTLNIPSVDILLALNSSYHRDPLALPQIVKLLNDVGVDDIGPMFRNVVDLLWNGNPDQWNFLLNDLGIHDPSTILLFKDNLSTSGTPPMAMGKYLRTLGAGPSDLAQFSEIFRHASRHESSDGIGRLMILSKQPYLLSISDLAKCGRYLSEESTETLDKFLICLHGHNYDTQQDILKFQAVYASMPPSTVGKLLTIFKARNQGESTAEIVKWIMHVGKRDPHAHKIVHSLDYLASSISIPNLNSLYRIIPACNITQSILEYLIQSIGLITVDGILDWYSLHGKDITGYGTGYHTSLEKTLLGDAHRRKNYSYFVRNYARASDFLHSLAKEHAGAYPESATSSSMEEYWARYRDSEKHVQQIVTTCVESVLHHHGGILLPSLLRASLCSTSNLQQSVIEIAPIIDELLEGKGPVGSNLTDLEKDAIELIYGTSLSSSADTWKAVMGREQHLHKWCAMNKVAMTWKRTVYQSKTPIEQQTLEYFQDASSFAKEFQVGTFNNMRDACKFLSPRRLTARGADTGTLRFHLGALLAVAYENQFVQEWLQEKFQGLSTAAMHSSESRQNLSELNTFFSTILPDALLVCSPGFVSRFSDADLIFFISRFGKAGEVPPETEIRSLALQAILEAQHLILPVYTKWVTRELKKFKPAKSKGASTSNLSAFVSKHPAAYFAKHATKLCSAECVEMWHEERHAHLVVFDTDRRIFVGMAMLYVESFPSLNNGQPAMILRAINPTAEALAAHDVSSIVDAFFGACTEIASANGLSCIAIPDACGQHFLSNQDVILGDIVERYIKPAKNHDSNTVAIVKLSDQNTSSRWGSKQEDELFYAYEHGRGSVDTLFVIWSQ